MSGMLEPKGNFDTDWAAVTNVLFRMAIVKKVHVIVIFLKNGVNLIGLGDLAASLVMQMTGGEDHLGERASRVAPLGDRIKWAVRARVVTNGTFCMLTLIFNPVT